MVDVAFRRVTVLPNRPEPNSLYFVRASGAQEFEFYLTGNTRQAIPLKAETAELAAAVAELQQRVSDLEDGVVTPPDPDPDPDPEPDATLIADRSIAMMSTQAPEDTVILIVSGVPTGTTPTLGVNDGTLKLSAGDEAGKWEVRRATGPISSDRFLNLRVNAGGQSVTCPLWIQNRKAPEKKYRNVRKPAVPQEYVDMMVAEINSSTNHPHIMGYTHTVTRDGDWEDMDFTGTGAGTHPDNYQTIPKAVCNPRTGQMQIVQVSTAVVNFGNYHVRRREGGVMAFKDCHIGLLGSLSIRPNVGEDIVFYHSTVMAHGGFYVSHDDAPSTTPYGRRVDIVTVAQEAPGVTVKVGLVLHGPNSIQSTYKADKLKCDQNVAQFQTTVHLPGLKDSGWQVRDTVCRPSISDHVRISDDPDQLGPRQFWGKGWNPETLATTAEMDVADDGFPLKSHQFMEIAALDLVAETVTFTTGVNEAQPIRTQTNVEGQTATWYPTFCNLTRQVRIRSANPDIFAYERGHLMTMPSGESVIANVEFNWYGRTRLDPSAYSPPPKGGSAKILYDRNPSDPAAVQVTDLNNVFGRYDLHDHYCSFSLAGRRALRFGNVFFDPPVAGHPEYQLWGSALVAHSTFTHSERNIMIGRNWKVEDGTEFTIFLNNTQIYMPGDGFTNSFGRRGTTLYKHSGHHGAANDIQSRHLHADDNETYNATDAWALLQQASYYFTDGLKNKFLMSPARRSLTYSDPLNGDTKPPFYNVYSHQGLNPSSFQRNVVVGSRSALRIFERNSTDRSDQTPFLIERLLCFGTDQLMASDSYVYSYAFDHCFYDRVAKFNGPILKVGGGFNQAISLVLCAFNNATYGLQHNALGPNLDGIFYRNAWGNVDQRYEQKLYKHPTIADPRDWSGYGVFGVPYSEDGQTPWPTNWGPNGIMLRKYEDLQEGQLPWPYPAASPRFAGDPKSTSTPTIGYSGVDPRPQNQQAGPGFWFNLPASNLTLDYNGSPASTFRLAGAIIDSAGVRTFGFNINSDSASDLHGFNSQQMIRRGTYITSAGTIVEAEGFFTSGGQTYVRLWFNNRDRITKAPIQGYVDAPVANVPSAVLNNPDNIVDPTKTAQDMSRRPELIEAQEVGFDHALTAPVVLSPISVTTQETDVPFFWLRSNQVLTKWMKKTGVTDNAAFEIVFVEGQYGYRWTGGAARPTTADEVLHPTFLATNPLSGAVTEFSPTVTNHAVADNLAEFNEDWAAADGPLNELFPHWTNREAGTFIIANDTLTHDGTAESTVWKSVALSGTGPIEVETVSLNDTNGKFVGLEFDDGIYVYGPYIFNSGETAFSTLDLGNPIQKVSGSGGGRSRMEYDTATQTMRCYTNGQLRITQSMAGKTCLRRVALVRINFGPAGVGSHSTFLHAKTQAALPFAVYNP